MELDQFFLVKKSVRAKRAAKFENVRRSHAAFFVGYQLRICC